MSHSRHRAPRPPLQLAATLRGADSSRSGFVSLPEFRAALGAAGAPLPDDDAEAAFAALGGSKGGRIPIEEAHATLRFAGAMPEPRRALVCKVFAGGGAALPAVAGFPGREGGRLE